MKMIALNGSPRKNWNTAQILQKIIEGGEAEGAECELINLQSLKYSGCMSCFLCKLPDGEHYGRCAVKDELTPVLDKIHAADVIVLGSPIYFGTETASMRALMERMWFQYYLYTRNKPPLSPRKKATALVYTMNMPDSSVYGHIINNAKRVMEGIFAPCELFISEDTKQFGDYSKYEADYFDVDAKLKRHNEIFPEELKQAYELGRKLVS